MNRIVLDANIWDKLAVDAPGRERLGSLVSASAIEIIVPDTLLQQLEASPFGGVPDWFAVNVIPDSVFVLDHSRLDHARLGDGEVFTAQRGESA